MNRYLLILFLIPLFLNCKGAVKDEISQIQTYGNTTENTKISAEKIDGAQTYEIYFTLDKPASCMTIDIESAQLQKSFPVQNIPKRTFFYIEKKLNIQKLKTGSADNFTPLARNFTNDWELYSPVKVCGNKNEPLSTLDTSEYRIRFTAFEKKQLYYIITVTCESKILFTGYIPPVKK
jgi:hypothetical protein